MPSHAAFAEMFVSTVVGEHPQISKMLLSYLSLEALEKASPGDGYGGQPPSGQLYILSCPARIPRPHLFRYTLLPLIRASLDPERKVLALLCSQQRVREEEGNK